MSNYTKATDFAAKDALTSGNSAKRILGTELDAEFTAIATATASKQNSSAKGQASGYASLDASTLVPREQLGTGTPADTKYLRGDGTWQPLADITGAVDLDAEDIGYDNAASGLSATDVQEAIDELAAAIATTATGFVITGNEQNVDVYARLGSPTGAGPFTVTIATGVVVASGCPSTPALDFTGFDSGATINLVNHGYIIGGGGDGGNGGYAESHSEGQGDTVPMPGRNGGNAIKGPGASRILNVDNTDGYIFGGGGGGGGGGHSYSDPMVAVGGGGGGGAGGGRGGRAQGFTESGTAYRANDGGDGSGGRLGAAGTGGTGNQVGSGEGGTGGAGGGYGANGAAGTSPTSQGTDIAGAAAGTAGKAVDVQSATVNITAGNNGTQVKGAVS